MAASPRWPPSRRARAVIAVGLGVLGLLLSWAASAGPLTPDTTPPAAPYELSEAPLPSSVSPATAEKPARSKDRADVRDRTAGRVLPESDPQVVSIPSIGVRSRLVDLGLDADGVMEVPRDPSQAGWFSRSATPGALGPAVIAGHVTWDGPAVFSRLGTLRRGASVAVTRKDGKVAVFTVSRVARYPKSRFPSRAVYGTINHAGLRLITCGGTYDTVAHRYEDNVVVFARLTAVHEARG